MSLIGIDLNATRARAVSGPLPRSAIALPLEDDRFDLPLAVGLEGKHPAIGLAGASLSRRLPHLACLDFLPHLGTDRAWSAGKHRLDAAGALGLVFQALHNPLRSRAGGASGMASGVALALPPYLDGAQVALIGWLAEQAHWHLFGSLSSPLAAALSAFSIPEGGTAFSGLVLVVDLDGHALTWSVVDVADGHARLLHTQASPRLGRNAWLLRLLDGVADRCVRLSRRDPRESAEAEQSLHDQLARYLEAGTERPLLELSLQAGAWYQHLMFHAEELMAFVLPLVRQAVLELEALRVAMAPYGEVSALLLTPAAGHLPGLRPALEAQLRSVVLGRPAEEDEGAFLSLDGFGDEPPAPPGGTVSLRVLGPDALARAAHGLAVRIHRGEVPPGHHEALLLPLGQPDGPVGLDAGPPRLNFRGRDHLLAGATFVLGRDPRCDLVFESELYPTVSARHCEIHFDRRAYLLYDRSRHGTLLNDRRVRQTAALHSGDWIRLGPAGPVLRFLGQHAAPRR
jgi:hypothetical protein